MKEEILKLISNLYKSHRSTAVKKNAHMVEWLQKEYPETDLNIAINSLLKNISPYCCICKKPLKFIGKKTCSIKCRSEYNAAFQDKILQKRKSTFIKKYGTDNPSKISSFQEKRLNTMIDKYGAKAAPKSPEVIKKITENLNKKGRDTLMKKYGVSNPGQLKDHHNKCASTMLKNLGVDHYSKTENYKKNQKEKLLEKWTEIFPPEIELLSIDKNENKIKLFENPNKEIKFKCTDCKSTEIIPTETAKWRIRECGTPCKVCGGIKIGSIKQNQLAQYIKNLGINIIINFNLDNNRQIDILCPDYNIGFEFNGLFWHNDTRIDKNYHYNKTNAANTQGIRLIHIFEDEWDHRQEIVKSRIRNLLGKNTKKIYARNCNIDIVNYEITKNFFEQNHIQGFANSSISLGLYYNNNLVSIMSFSKPNSAKGQKYKHGHWELLRFSSLINTSVVGAAGKLLKYFIKNYDPIQILSFADNRWSQGDLYKTLGFVNQGNTSLNYWYINLKEGRRIHRYKLRKNKSDNPELTEYQNRLNQGYLRIWDCGSSKWIWTK